MCTMFLRYSTFQGLLVRFRIFVLKLQVPLKIFPITNFIVPAFFNLHFIRYKYYY